MKALRLTCAAIVAIACAAACSHKEYSAPETTPEAAPQAKTESQPVHLTVTAHLQGQTKTIITEDNTGDVPVFTTSWNVGDRCWVTEYMDDVDTGEAYSTALVQSEPLSSAGNPADFDFILGDDTGREGHTYTYSYFASTLRNTRGYDSQSNSEFHTFILPQRQKVAPHTIDPESDILISDVQVFNSRQTELSFEFARVGTIVKMTVKGLQEGDIIDSGRWLTGEHFYATNGLEDMNKYFPKEGRYKVEGGTPWVEFERVQGNPIVADSNGEAVLYLRCFSGVIDDWFSLELFVRRGGYVLEFYKYADLAGASKTLQFNDGGVTMFSVSVLPSQGHFSRDNYGSTLTNSWTAGDAVSVYNVTKGAPMTGTLTANESGRYVQFEGSLEGGLDPGDILRLSYQNPAYGSQDGTLTGIRSTCDFATAEALVAGIESGQPVLSDGTFQNHQAIVKYTCNQPVKQLVITADHLVGGPVTVTPASGSSELYVALSNTSGAEEIYTFQATRPDDSVVTLEQPCNYVDGQYYTASLDFAVQVSSVSLDRTELELSVGGSATLVPTVLPDNALDKTVSWSSDNEEVATVTTDGVVTAVAPGTAVITVTTTDGSKTATCNVTVLAGYDPVLHPFTIEAVNNDTEINFTIASGKEFEYSKDNGANWIPITSNENTITLSAGEVVLLRGNAASCYNSLVKCTKDCYIYGNLMSLIDPTGYTTNKTIGFEQAFYSLFYNTTYPSDAAHIKNHPTKDVALPATTLTTSCYERMFRGTGIDRSPVLPAQTLVSSCYQRMFQGCASLTKVTCLATSGLGNCYNWLNGVPASGDFYKASGATGWSNDIHGIPSGWKVHDM